MRTFLFTIPGHLDVAVHAPCYTLAVGQLRQRGLNDFLLRRWDP